LLGYVVYAFCPADAAATAAVITATSSESFITLSPVSVLTMSTICPAGADPASSSFVSATGSALAASSAFLAAFLAAFASLSKKPGTNFNR